MATPLPEFTKPPVSEVALSVSFTPLEKWRSAHAGLYWSRIHTAYPLTEVHPPLPFSIETFEGKARASQMAIRVELANPDLQRYWFTTDPASRIVQIQNNRFVINWRKIQGDEPYPRYAKDLRSKFIDEWTTFNKFLEDQKIDAPVVQQCEVTYVNHIQQDDWKTASEAADLFSFWCRKGTDGFLPEPESTSATGTFLMPDQAGRLHFNMQRVIKLKDDEQEHAVQLQIYAVNKPKSSAIDDIMKQLDIGHDWVVRGFADLTSARAHELWGRKQ
jgi:uncharacterized protein (TIGR04255 family)